MNKINILIIIILATFISCKKEQSNPTNYNIKKGFYIVNEGNFTWGNSSLSFYNEENNTIENDVFYKANNAVLGDVGNDMKIINNKGFICVNNSGLIYVINPKNCKHIATIADLVSPRYILPVNDSLAYVSDLYSPYITIINTNKLTKYSTINVGTSTEAMIKVENKVFVTSWSFNHFVYVINCINHSVIDSISVGLQPQSIVVDKNNDIWVLCDGGYPGNPIGHEAPSLWQISANTHQIKNKIVFPSANYSARSLIINKNADTLAFIYKDVYVFSINDTVFPSHSWLSSINNNFYSIWYHPEKPWIIISDAKNFVKNGEVYIYNKNRQLIANFEAGIIPSAFCYYKEN